MRLFSTAFLLIRFGGFTFNFPPSMRRRQLFFYGPTHIFVKTKLGVVSSLFDLVVATNGGNVVDNHARRKKPSAGENGQIEPNFSVKDEKLNT